MNSTEYLAKMIADLQIVEQLIETGIPRGVVMYLSVPQRDVVVEALKRHAQGALLREALQFIADGYDNHNINHVDYRVKVYQVATDALGPADGGKP